MIKQASGSYLLVGALLIAFVISSTESRSFPRSSSRTFRFPSSEEDKSVNFKETSLAVEKRLNRENNSGTFFPASDKPQGRHNVININNTPIKILVPESPVREVDSETQSQKGQDEISSIETVEADVFARDDKNKSSHEDEPLLEVLCPLSDKNVSSSLADDGDESSGSWTSAESKIRYDLRAGKCAEVGNKEHCGKNMIFVADIDSSAYGYCECDYENKILRKERKQAALLARTPLVFHQNSNSCHRLYEQAYCNDGQWLILSREAKGPVCEKRQCPKHDHRNETAISAGTAGAAPLTRRRASKLLTPSFWTDSPSTTPPQTSTSLRNESALVDVTESETVWVPLNGSGPCVKLFANNPRHCDESEQVVFNVGDIVPKCGFIGRGIEGRAIIRNACPPGSYYSIIGRCQPDWDF